MVLSSSGTHCHYVACYGQVYAEVNSTITKRALKADIQELMVPRGGSLQNPGQQTYHLQIPLIVRNCMWAK